MAKNKIITSQGNVQFINSKGKTISMHPMHCYAVYQDDTVSFLFIYMKEYSGQAFFSSQFEDLEVDGETYDSIDALKEAIAEAFAKAGAQARTEIVDELPETGYTNTIYLLPKEHGTGYDEYIYNEDEGWQLIGDTDIEFERYLEKTEFYDYSAATEVKIDYISGAVDDNASDIQFLSGAVDTEISDREAADAVISGAVDTLSTNLSNEVSRAQNAEQTLQNNINTVNSRVDAEQLARANADNALSGAIDSFDDKIEALSGEVQTMGDEAIVDAEYVSSSTTIDFYNASGAVVAQVDATDFITDGMIDDVRIETISGVTYLVIDFNTASGKEDIKIPLTDIFNPDNYYDKTAVDALLANKANSADVYTKSEVYTKGEVDGKLSDKADLSALTEDERVWGEALNDLNSRINTVSGDVADKANVTALTQVNNVVTAHTANTDVHVTSAEKATWNNKSDFSGSYNDLTNKLSAGTNISIVDNVINATGGGSEYVAGTGIDIDSANTITATYRGFLSYDNPQQSLSDYEGEFYIKTPWIDCEGVETGECIFFTAENTDEYQYYFSLNPITKQYSVTSYPSGKENDWENYFSIGFDDEMAMFKVTTLQQIAQVNDNGCTRFFRIGSGYDDYSYKYSGTTEDAFDGVIDNFNNYVKSANLGAYNNQIVLSVDYDGVSRNYYVILDDLTGENGHIHTNIQIPTGVSGWTDIQFAGCNILANNPSNSTFRLSGDTSDLANFNKNDFDTSWMIIIEGYGTAQDSLTYDSNQDEFIMYSSWFGEGSEFGEVTFNYDDVANTITIAYPDTVSIYGSNQKVKISDVYNNSCAFGTSITKFEVFDEYKQPLVPYVKGKIDTSAIVTAITSSSTDAQVPSAKAVNDKLGGLSLVKLTQAQYDALVSKDSNTLYIISD